MPLIRAPPQKDQTQDHKLCNFLRLDVRTFVYISILVWTHLDADLCALWLYILDLNFTIGNNDFEKIEWKCYIWIFFLDESERNV